MPGVDVTFVAPQHPMQYRSAQADVLANLDEMVTATLSVFPTISMTALSGPMPDDRVENAHCEAPTVVPVSEVPWGAGPKSQGANCALRAIITGGLRTSRVAPSHLIMCEGRGHGY